MRHEPTPEAATPTVNVINVLRVADAIEKRKVMAPRLFLPGEKNIAAKMGFNMGTVMGHGRADLSGHFCDTSACVAGWTAVTLLRRTRLTLSERDDQNLIAFARRSLGLTSSLAEQLFFPSGFRKNWHTPAQAVRTLRHLADTALAGRPEVRWDLPEA